jgi:hypothetical protein
MPAAVADIFTYFDARSVGTVSADEAAEIATMFGPFAAPVSFAPGETFTAEAVQAEIDRASAGDDAQRATALFTSVFGPDAKADEAALALLGQRATGCDAKASAQRILATFNARRVGAAEFATLDAATRADVPSRQKRALVTKRGPKAAAEPASAEPAPAAAAKGEEEKPADAAAAPAEEEKPADAVPGAEGDAAPAAATEEKPGEAAAAPAEDAKPAEAAPAAEGDTAPAAATEEKPAQAAAAPA